MNRQQDDYQRVARMIRWLEQQAPAQPGLPELATEMALSPAHLQKLFRRWAGVSPKQYLGFLTQAHARQQLRASTVLDAAHEVGLSGPGRLHDLMIQWTAMTPGEYRREGAGLTVRYGIHDCPFGSCLLAVTDRGLCHLAFADNPQAAREQIPDLTKEWPLASCAEAPEETATWLKRIFPAAHRAGDREDAALPLLLRGSPFQLKVWEALLALPDGALLSYQQLAEQCGQASATRAVASAVAKNRIGYLIPCHRVIRANGALGGYRWDPLRKRALIAWEAAGQPACSD